MFRLHGPLNKTLAVVGLSLLLTSVATAASWSVSVEDDLFSKTGKKAMLGTNGEQRPLVFDCDSSGISFALLEKSRLTNDERRFEPRPAKLLIKVDDAEPFNFSASVNRRNDYYFQIQVAGTQYPTETAELLHQIQAAQSKILVGVEFPSGDKYSDSVGVSGSTAATGKFLKACGIQ